MSKDTNEAAYLVSQAAREVKLDKVSLNEIIKDVSMHLLFLLFFSFQHFQNAPTLTFLSIFSVIFTLFSSVHCTTKQSTKG